MEDVQPFSFGRSEPQAPVMLSGLDRLGEKLGRRLRELLEPMVGAKPDIIAHPMQAMAYGTWAAQGNDFAALSLYRILPLKGLSLLRIEAGMVSLLVDCFYGGRGQVPAHSRTEFTPTEDRLAGRLATSIMEKLTDTWQETLPLDITLVGRETGLGHLAVAQPDEMMAIQRFDITLGRGTIWPVDIVMPLASLRAVEPMLGTKVHDETGAGDPVWQARLGRQMEKVSLPARTVLARPNMTLSELMQLEPGDVIPVHINRSLPLIVGDRIIAHGTIGDQNGRAAFMIEQLAEGTDQ